MPWCLFSSPICHSNSSLLSLSAVTFAFPRSAAGLFLYSILFPVSVSMDFPAISFSISLPLYPDFLILVFRFFFSLSLSLGRICRLCLGLLILFIRVDSSLRLPFPVNSSFLQCPIFCYLFCFESRFLRFPFPFFSCFIYGGNMVPAPFTSSSSSSPSSSSWLYSHRRLASIVCSFALPLPNTVLAISIS